MFQSMTRKEDEVALHKQGKFYQKLLSPENTKNKKMYTKLLKILNGRVVSFLPVLSGVGGKVTTLGRPRVVTITPTPSETGKNDATLHFNM